MFCGKCGNELPDDAKFCGKCGYKIETKNESVENQINTPIYNETEDLPTFNGGEDKKSFDQTVYIPKERKQEAFKPEERVRKKKSFVLPLIISFVTLAIVALGVLVFVFKDDIFGNDNSEESDTTSESADISIGNESKTDITVSIEEVSAEESEPEGIVYGDSGISNGQWTLSTDNGNYELLLKLDGSAILKVTNKGGSVVNFESRVKFADKLNNVKDILNLDEGEELSVFTDFRKNQIVIKYNDKFIILFHKNSQKIMPDEALSGYWRKGTDSFAIDEEYITLKGDKKRYLAFSEKNFYVYKALEESEFVFNSDISFEGLYAECVIDENGYLDLIYGGESYSNLRHVE